MLICVLTVGFAASSLPCIVQASDGYTVAGFWTTSCTKNKQSWSETTHFSECTCEMHALPHSKSIRDSVSFPSNQSVPCGKNNTLDSSLYIICFVPYDNRDWRVCNESAPGMCSDSPKGNKLPSASLTDDKRFLRVANQISMSAGRYLVSWFLGMAQTVARIFFSLWFVVVSNCQMLSWGAHWIGCASLLSLPLDRFFLLFFF